MWRRCAEVSGVGCIDGSPFPAQVGLKVGAAPSVRTGPGSAPGRSAGCAGTQGFTAAAPADDDDRSQVTCGSVAGALATVSTGQVDLRMTVLATLPRIIRPNAPRPWVPMTIRSAPNSCAALQISLAASPSRSTVAT